MNDVHHIGNINKFYATKVPNWAWVDYKSLSTHLTVTLNAPCFEKMIWEPLLSPIKIYALLTDSFIEISQGKNMNVTGKVWVFYNSESGKQTKPLSTIQAQMALLSLKSRHLKSIFIWTPGWENWQSVESFLKTKQNFFAISHPPRPEKRNYTKFSKIEVADVIDEIANTVSGKNSHDPSYTKVELHSEKSAKDYGYYHQDFNGEDLDLSKIRRIKSVKFKPPKHSDTNARDKRRASIRHDFKIEVVIISEEKSFRTYSKNISLGGTLLDDEIPKSFLHKSFDLIIINRFETDAHKRQLLFKAKIVGDITDPRRLMFLDAKPQMLSRLDALLKAYITYQDHVKKKTG